MSDSLKNIVNTPYYYDTRIDDLLSELRGEVKELRREGALSRNVLKHLRLSLKIKNIYHSNSIEGNSLSIGETQQVIEQGFTILGKPLKDTLEAKNLSNALDMFEEMADREGNEITEVNIRDIHRAILSGISDEDAGRYRTIDVRISGAEFSPPSCIEVPPQMEEFTKWMKSVSIPSLLVEDVDPVVLACVAHAWFVSIHPFIDGNGRTARIIMNLILMRYSYPIAIIYKEDRKRYYEALETSQAGDLTPFINLVLESVRDALDAMHHAIAQSKFEEQWISSTVTIFGREVANKAKNEYEVWSNAMELLRSYFKQTISSMDEQASAKGVGRVLFWDYGKLDLEKYMTLRSRRPTKRTWFFRVTFESGIRRANYLFFFGFASTEMNQKLNGVGVTLYPSHENYPGNYEKLETTTDVTTPNLIEVGYLPHEQQFMWRFRGGGINIGQVEKFVKQFIDQVIEREF